MEREESRRRSSQEAGSSWNCENICAVVGREGAPKAALRQLSALPAQRCQLVFQTRDLPAPCFLLHACSLRTLHANPLPALLQPCPVAQVKLALS